MIVRARTEADLDACVELARIGHEVDGYPLRVPPDLRAFLAPPDVLAAWVAEDGGRVVGHVALHPDSWPGVMDLAREATGRPAEQIAVVARLLVAPAARRRGLGRELLATARSEATARGRTAILDVSVGYAAAIALYEACGWRAVGQVTFTFPDGAAFPEHVYVAPAEGG